MLGHVHVKLRKGTDTSVTKLRSFVAKNLRLDRDLCFRLVLDLDLDLDLELVVDYLAHS